MGLVEDAQALRAKIDADIPTLSAASSTTAALSGGVAVQASNNPHPFLVSTGVTGAFANNPTITMSYVITHTIYNVYAKVSALA